MTSPMTEEKPALWKRFVVETIRILLISWLFAVHSMAFSAYLMLSHDGGALDAALNAQDLSFMEKELQEAGSEEKRAALIEGSRSGEILFGAVLFFIPTLLLWQLWRFTRKRLWGGWKPLGYWQTPHKTNPPE